MVIEGRGMVAIKEVLKSSQLFGGLAGYQLDKVVRLCREETCEMGTVIFTEGSIAKDLYIVEQGKVALEMNIRFGPGPGRKGTIDIITKGQVLGWSALTEPCTFTMSARCIEKTKVIALDTFPLQHLLEDDRHIGYKVMQELANVERSRLDHTRETLAHILSITSHDLKAPLAAVQSYLQVILGGFAGGITDKQRNMLTRSSDRISGLLNLIDNILDISRIDTAEMKIETASLLEVARNSIEDIRPLAEEKGIQLIEEWPEELPQIHGSPSRLQQVITNLLSNAIKFTSPQGMISFRLRETQDGIRAEVIDSGIGISAEDLPKIFDDFYRGGDLEKSGAGLGLSISRKIIEAHGGKIWAESPCPESGEGSKLTFTLPKDE